jgi:hypothetical protein
VVITLAGWSVSLLVVYGVILAWAILLFVLLAWRVRVSALAVLQRADSLLRFQERLSTAYEYLHQHASNRFVPGLVAEAERVAQQVDPREVFPTPWPRRVWGIPLLLAAVIGFTRLDMVSLQFEDLAYEEATGVRESAWSAGDAAWSNWQSSNAWIAV